MTPDNLPEIETSRGLKMERADYSLSDYSILRVDTVSRGLLNIANSRILQVEETQGDVNTPGKAMERPAFNNQAYVLTPDAQTKATEAIMQDEVGDLSHGSPLDLEQIRTNLAQIRHQQSIPKELEHDL